jgi:2,3-bisphosphoglycerate-independent phosphoglycerate mutase
MSKRPRPIILTVLDGWGFRAETAGNAIALARKPNYDELLRKFPNTLIHTSGKYVGLPDGQMGNSEVGHLNIGAGRIVHMDSTKLDLMILNGELYKNSVLLDAMARGRTRQLHLIGLLSNGGVHSHIDHLFALLKMAREQKVERVLVHCFMDGRDTPPHSGAEFLDQLQHNMQEFQTGQIASVVGRYYAMDRDNRWERIERAYRAMVHGDAPVRVVDPIAAVRASYDRGTSDEFIEPIVVTKPIAAGESGSGEPIATLRDEDSVIFYNFRADRARQMTRALSEPGFDKFSDPSRPKNLLFTGITQYDKTFSWMKFLLTQDKLDHILAQVFADMNFKNLRVAETEKYAHVTYFFNGGVEKPFGGEERILVPSPKVPTYDLKPEMSAAGIADAVTNAIRKGDFDAIIMNFANADMVGHSGNLDATIKAVETVDACLGQIRQALNDASDTAWLITADHGNAETMIDPRTGGPHTYHTTNPVPFIFVSNDANALVRPNGSLQDISPTILGALGIKEPIEMTGHDLREPVE